MKKLISFFEKHPILSIVLIGLPIVLFSLSSYPLTIMEARNFITAREMIHDNHWLLTTMNGIPRYEKPPLPTWLSALSALSLGQSGLFAWRLPAALMVIFLAVVVYYFSLILRLSKNQSLQNALIALTSFYIISITIEAPWDIFAHGFMAAGIYFLFRFFQEEKNIWKNVLLASFFTGLSLLSKGPVSLYALLLPFLIAYFSVYKREKVKQKWIYFIAYILLAVAIGGWWWIYVYLNDTASTSVFSKETKNWSSYHTKVFYYYWYFFVQSGIWTIPAVMSLLYPYMKKRVHNFKAYKFTFLWTVIAVILLSLIPEKKMRYLMPVLIPLSVNTGFYIEYLIENFKKIKNKYELIPPYLNTILLIIISFAGPLVIFFKFHPFKNNFAGWALAVLFSFYVIGFILFRSLRKKDFKSIFYSMVFLSGLYFILIVPLRIKFGKESDAKRIQAISLFEKQNQIKTYSLGIVAPEFLWYYNGKIKDLLSGNQQDIPQESKFGIIISKREKTSPGKFFGDDYQIKKIGEYNLNTGKKQRSRLIHEYYIIKKK